MNTPTQQVPNKSGRSERERYAERNPPEAPPVIDWIQTHSGRKVYPLALEPGAVDIDDIAHALSHACRFTGHTPAFYSVAQHSLHVMHALEYAPGRLGMAAYDEAYRPIKLAALLHDASEAYLCDLARPLKVLPEFAAYREAEARAERAIEERFGLRGTSPEVRAAIKEADERVLETEVRDVLGSRHPDWKPRAQPCTWRIVPWEPARARREFVNAFLALGGA